MARGEKGKSKFNRESRKENQNPVVIVSSDDDEEANEDLSLKIVEKALSKRASKLKKNKGFVFDDSNDTSMVDLCSSPKVTDAIMISSSDGVDDVASVDVKRRRKERKKKNKIKIDIAVETNVVSKWEENAGTDGKGEIDVEAQFVEDVPKIESTDQITAEIPEDQNTAEIPEDQNTAEIPENMVLRKLLRGPRYFDSPDRGWETCFHCGEEGHMAVNCPSFTKRKKPCFVCGSLEHPARQCQKGQDCFICKKGGHRAKDCRERNLIGSKIANICLRCGDSGHEMFACRNDYSRDDLKEIQCYICKQFGHLCCVSTVGTHPIYSCYKCGQLGHLGSTCNKIHWGGAETTVNDSIGSCFKCGEEGHFARDCFSSAKIGKRKFEFSTPQPSRVHKPIKEYSGKKSAPTEHGKLKKKKTHYEERGFSTPRKPKHRGGWITEEPEYSPRKMKNNNHWRSPSTPSYEGLQSSRYGGSNSYSKPSYESNKFSRYGSAQSSHSYSSQNNSYNRYSASRFANSGYNNARRDNDWW